MLKAVLFDVDDTLFDHRYSSRSALAALQQKYPSHLSMVPLDEIEAHNLRILNEIHIDVLAGSLSIDNARAKRFATLLGIYGMSLSPEESLTVGGWYRAQYEASWRATPGATMVLEALRNRGITVGVVTNNLVAEQTQKLEQCGLAPLVDSVTISEEAGCTKPDERIFQIALERVKSAPQQALMVGDSWNNDIIGARNAGIQAIWYNCYNEPSPDVRVPQVTSLSELHAAINAIVEMGS